MTLERCIALVFLLICCLYGYTAFVPMQLGLLPFELNMVFLPNTLPKGLAILGALLAMIVLLSPGATAGSEPRSGSGTEPGTGATSLREYKSGQAVLLLVLMIAYALLLRPAGFLLSTFAFLFLGAFILGERRWLMMFIAGTLGSFIVWYLVQQVLGIFLRPLPWFA